MYRLYLRPALISILLVSSAPCIAAQDDTASQLARFEVASVKPVDPNTPNMESLTLNPGGRVVITSRTLKDLIAIAFRVSYWQISGGDVWTGKDAYNIEAKPSESVGSAIRNLRHSLWGIEDEHLCQMLQALLVDRFQLKFHREAKTGDVYVLERNGKPLGMQPAELPPAAAEAAEAAATPSSFGNIGYVGGRWSLAATSMPQLAKFGSNFILRAPVEDRTGLAGLFDYRQPVPDVEPNYADNTDSFMRLMPHLGLKLERSKGPIGVFIVDSASKPSPN